MRVVQIKPPIYEEVKRHFDIDESSVVMTYGDHIYTPSGMLSMDLMIHEAIHVSQQNSFSGGPAAWWRKYLEDPTFRLEQEVDAYRAQFQYLSDGIKDRNVRAGFGFRLGHQLASKQYGRMVAPHLAYDLITT